jgi:hypothetical protein
MDEGMATRQQLLTRVHKEREAWEALVNEIGEDRMTQPGSLGDWTFKDTVAHLTAWAQAVEIQKLEAAHRREPITSVPGTAGWNVEQTNLWIYCTHRYDTVQSILQQSRQLWDRLEKLIHALPEQDLTEPGRFTWMNGRALGAVVNDFVEHFHQEHEPLIRAWLAAGATR